MLMHPYNYNWSNNFSSIQGLLQTALNGLYVAIEHIGSTAVPGLAAKPIIDIDIVVDGPANFDQIKAVLESIGYYHNGNQGIPGREVFKRDPAKAHHTVLDGIAHHLYVCPANSEALRKHILFREYLRAHAPTRVAYENLKYALAAAAGQDRKRYAALKEVQARKFIEEVMEKAASSCKSNLTIP